MLRAIEDIFEAVMQGVEEEGFPLFALLITLVICALAMLRFS